MHLDSQPDTMDFISCIAKTMFKDGSTNWGRITSLVAFGAVVCSQLKEAQRERCIETVAEQISSYLISEQHDWLLRNNGWVSRAAGLKGKSLNGNGLCFLPCIIQRGTRDVLSSFSRSETELSL